MKINKKTVEKFVKDTIYSKRHILRTNTNKIGERFDFSVTCDFESQTNYFFNLAEFVVYVYAPVGRDFFSYYVNFTVKKNKFLDSLYLFEKELVLPDLDFNFSVVVVLQAQTLI